MGIPDFDGEIIRKEYARMPIGKRRLSVQALGNTVHTYAQARNIGAMVDPICPTCGMHEDTTQHRLFECGSEPRMVKLLGSTLRDSMFCRPPIPDSLFMHPC